MFVQHISKKIEDYNENLATTDDTKDFTWNTYGVGPILIRIKETDLNNESNYDRGLWQFFAGFDASSNPVWTGIDPAKAQDAWEPGCQHPYVFFENNALPMEYKNLCIYQNIRKVNNTWVAIGANSDGEVYFSCCTNLSKPAFTLKTQAKMNGDIKPAFKQNSPYSNPTFNPWGFHYLSFFDANTTSTDRNFQSNSASPAYRIVVSNGTNTYANHSGYYHANLSFSGF